MNVNMPISEIAKWLFEARNENIFALHLKSVQVCIPLSKNFLAAQNFCTGLSFATG